MAGLVESQILLYLCGKVILRLLLAVENNREGICCGQMKTATNPSFSTELHFNCVN
jgi:hypothetical protein